MKNKPFIHVSRMKTEIGYLPVLGNFQKVNRPIMVYYAEKKENKGISSIFYLIRKKDVFLLEKKGYTIYNIFLKKGEYARAIGYNTGAVLEKSNY